MVIFRNIVIAILVSFFCDIAAEPKKMLTLEDVLIKYQEAFYNSENPDINKKIDYAGTTALIAASSSGDLKCVKILLDNGAQVACKTRGGITPLSSACHGAYNEIFLLLIDKLVKEFDSKKTKSIFSRKKIKDLNYFVNKKDWIGFNPLLYAVTECSPDVVEKLLNNGAKISIEVASLKQNALMLACAADKTAIVELLINKLIERVVIDENIKDKQEYIKEFINKKDYKGKTALNLAKNDCAKLIDEYLNNLDNIIFSYLNSNLNKNEIIEN
ncbi:MAG: hypothetical protein SZ59_C0005G0019 [candidate division TM6 bacterium GW2011_GWF2_28_16]|nr:MAG: hypothetical protein SZ59_C0005G0019 [candidate division TM6 bacterium GW2011_GWF2_28_16]